MYMVLEPQMAKSEIPSIVVQTGCAGNELRSNSSLEMDGPHRQLGRASRLAKQEEIELEEDGAFASSSVTIHIEDGSCRDLEVAGASREEDDASKMDFFSNSQSTPDDAGTQSPDSSWKEQASNSRSHVKGSSRHLLAKQGSSQGTGSMEGSSPSLSRDSSTETYTDSTGIDLQQFIVDTLHKSQKDRLMLLKIEQDLITFVKDYKCQSFKFAQMSSYNRMLVHRVAAFFGLEHNVDKNGTSVIVNKTKNTRIPDIKFQDQIRDELVPDEPKKLILKRDSASFEEGKEKSPERQSSMDSKRSKSFEEREEEYEKARARIFNQDSLDILLEGYGESPYSRSQDETLSSRRSSQDDLRWVGEPRPWSSTDSDSSGRKGGAGSFECEGAIKSGVCNKLKMGQSKSDSEGAKESLTPNYGAKPTVTKASSFGGISVLVSTSSTKTTSRLTKSESLNVTSNVTIVTNVPNVVANSIEADVSSPLPSPTIAATPKLEATLSETSVKVNTESKGPSDDSPPSPKPTLASPRISSQTGKWESNSNEKEMETSNRNVNVRSVSHHNLVYSNAASNAPMTTTYYNTDNYTKVMGKIPNSSYNMSSTLSSQGHLQVPSNSGLNRQQSHSPGSNASTPIVANSIGPVQQSNSPAFSPHPNQAVVYIPYPAIMGHQHPNSMGMQQPHPMNSIMGGSGPPDARHPGQEGVNEISNQLANMGFGPPPPQNGPGSLYNQQQGGKSLAMDYSKTSAASSGTTQSYYVPSDKGQSYIGQQPSTQLYYIHQLPPPVNMRYVQPLKGAESVADCGPPQSPSPHMSGQQILPGYSLLTFSQNSDNLGYSTSPYNFVYVPPQPGTTPPSSNAALMSHQPNVQTNPNSVPVYPFGNMMFGNASGGSTLLGPQNSSQLAPPHQGGPQYVPQPPPPPGSLTGSLPMCVLANGSNSNNLHGPPPNITQGGNPMLGNHYGAPIPFRPQTPPSQSGNAIGHGPRGPMQTTNNQSQLAPFVSYAFITPPMHHQNHPQNASSSGAIHVNTLSQSNAGQANATHHQYGSSGALQTPPIHHPPSFMTAFHILRPAIPMGNVRNSTPPPQQPPHPSGNQQNIIPIQLPTPPPQQQQAMIQGKGNGPYSYPVTKAADPGGQLAQNQETNNFRVNHLGANINPKTGRLSGPLPMAPTQFRMSGPMYRGRGLPLMPEVRLVGHPLQQQLNPLLFPPHHQPRGRFPPPQLSSSPSFGPASLAGRGAKSRKQRTRWMAPGAGPISSGNGSKNQSYVLHPDDIYNRGNEMLIVEAIPDKLKRVELERLLEQVTSLGAKIHLYSLDGSNSSSLCSAASGSDFVVNLSKFQVYAVFENENAVQNALQNVKTAGKFQLRPLPSQQNYHHRQQQQQHPLVHRGGPPPTHPPSYHHHHHHSNRYHHLKEGPQSGNKSIS